MRQINYQKGEIRSLTGIRGIAALVVAIHHFISKYYIDRFREKSSESLLDYIAFNYANHGYLMVELFFILSGFVLALSYNKKFELGLNKNLYKSFMIKRFNRVYPLYFFSTIIYFFVFNLDKIKNLEILFVNFTFMEIWFPKEFTLNNVSWSLCTEWFLYLLFPFILIKNDFFKKNNFLLILLAVIVFLLAPIFNSQKLYGEGFEYSILELRMSNGSGALLRCLGSYLIGISIYNIYTNRPKIVMFLSQNWYLIIILLMLFYGINKSDIIVDLLFGALILALTQINKITQILSSKILYFLGLISYSIYLNHMIFLRFLNFSFKKNIWEENSQNIFIGLLVFIFLTIISSWFTYKFLEVPCNKWLNKKLKKYVS